MADARNVIPANIMAAAEKAGLSAPLWYVGRTNGPSRPQRKTLADLARESEAHAERDARRICELGWREAGFEIKGEEDAR